jgi:hypothetical protein
MAAISLPSARNRRTGSVADAVRVPIHFPIPNEPLIVGEQCTFARDQLLHEQCRLGFGGSKPANFVEMLVVAEDIREDDRVPGGERFARLPGLGLQERRSGYHSAWAQRSPNISEIFRSGTDLSLCFAMSPVNTPNAIVGCPHRSGRVQGPMLGPVERLYR